MTLSPLLKRATMKPINSKLPDDPNNLNSASFRNVLVFSLITFALILTWSYLFPPAHKDSHKHQTTTHQITSPAGQANGSNNLFNQDKEGTPLPSRPLEVKTDHYRILVDEATGDLVRLELLQQKAEKGKEYKEKMLLMHPEIHYQAQSRLIDQDQHFFLNNIPYKAETTHHTLQNGQDYLQLVLQKNAQGVEIKKILGFKRDSYLINFRYEITNKNNQPLALTGLYRLLHDGTPSDKSSFFTKFYTGCALYTPSIKFKKIPFTKLDEGKAELPNPVSTGWLGIIQHYFASIFLLQPKGQNSVCGGHNCFYYIDKRTSDGLYEVGFTAPLPFIEPASRSTQNVFLFSGPQEYSRLAAAADNLPLIKDYGIFHIFANPLFLVLRWIYHFVGNWGWSILLLVLLLKTVLFPLNSVAARSMAKMRKMAPKMQEIKDHYHTDKVKQQQAMVELYKKEKINPIGGCLPMLIQIPIFIGLYWALFNSVELRNAPWILWIRDLSVPDPYFILPIFLAVTMWLQTHFNPPAGDPMQQKMMKILPLVFSIMFFFFPAGLVLYWLVNNLFTMAQQWWINKKVKV